MRSWILWSRSSFRATCCRWLPALFILVSNSCLEQFDVGSTSFKESIVVDGLITDQRGPHVLTLSYSSTLKSDLDAALAVTGAIVTLHDTEGNSFPYRETEPGVYLTDSAVTGFLGLSYYITIKANGREYSSKPSKMLPAGAITDLYAQFEENVINFSDPSLPQDAIRIYFSSRGASAEEIFFRWRWTGTYEVETYPHLRVRPESPRPVPDPIPCSGMIFPPLKVVGPCECCKCYVPEYGSNVLISENTLFNTDEFNNVLLATLPYEAKRFYYKYRIKVEQLSLDEESYDYWHLIKAQQQSNNNLFQPNTIRVKGNVACTSHPDEPVQGFFAASAVVEMTLGLPRSLNKKPIEYDTLPTDCRTSYPGSTNVKPPNW